MQQTKNHKLNLIEMSDTFSTEPLNENMETIDAALKSASDTAAAISQRVGTLEAKHIAVGTYRGSGGGTINVGFKPRAVIIGGTASTVLVSSVSDAAGNYAGLTASGFQVTGVYCASGGSYNYVAID